MIKKGQLLTICLYVTSLTACGGYPYSSTHHYYVSYPSYRSYTTENTKFYPRNYTRVDYNNEAEPLTGASVPTSYYTGAYRSPTSHKYVDRRWVIDQDPRNYTIQIADDERASQVASVLYTVPKTNRTAEVKYYQGGKTYYRGVYGSYSTYEEAQNALNTLPPELRQGAMIKNWSNVQQTTVEQTTVEQTGATIP